MSVKLLRILHSWVEHIQVIDTAIKEVENSNRQLVSNMENVTDIVNVMTNCISDSDETTKRMSSKYEGNGSEYQQH